MSWTKAVAITATQLLPYWWLLWRMIVAVVDRLLSYWVESPSTTMTITTINDLFLILTLYVQVVITDY